MFRGVVGGYEGPRADKFGREIWQTFGKRSGLPRPLSRQDDPPAGGEGRRR